MDEAEKGQTIKELEKLIREFRSYKRLEEISPLSKNQEGYMRSLQYTLQRKIGTYKEFVVRLTGKRYAQELNYKFDFWDEALRSGGLKSRTLQSIEYCIQSINEAIGKLTDDITKGIRDEQGSVIGELSMRTAESPIQLFDALQFHPRVIQVSESLFKTGNYASAILEAFKAVNNFVKEKSGLSPNELRGMKDRPLMAKVFDEKEPLIKLNELITDTDINEQEGFKLLFMGATEGIRNPKAHDLIEMKDPHKTLEYLAFASLLIRRVEEGKVVKPKPPRERWDWEKYQTKLGISKDRIKIGKSLFDKIVSICQEKQWSLTPIFRQKYIPFKFGGRNVLTITYWEENQFCYLTFKLGQPAEELGLTNPFPDIKHGFWSDYGEYYVRIEEPSFDISGYIPFMEAAYRNVTKG